MAFFTPALPGYAGPKSFAAWPVWSDSSRAEVRFQPLAKRDAVRLWHRARAFDRQTKQPGRHGGALGHAALQVLQTLIFDFLNYRNGRLDPSYDAIARKANLGRRTVARALARLKLLGVLNWVRRCAETVRDGRFALEQETNAYAVLPCSQWRGFRHQPDTAPPPERGTWGDHPPLPDPISQAAAERQEGGTMRAVLAMLEADPADPLAAALARLGRGISGGAA